MVTKAIIESVENVKVEDNNITQYAVRLPIFHGYGSTDATPVKFLPKAVYCTPPHMEKTKLCKGDIVWVAIEDFDLSQIVILGMIPTSSTRDLYGSIQTQSGVIFENVQTFKSTKTGSVELPYDTKVWITTNDNKVTSGNDYVNGEEISYLKNVESPIQDQINGVKGAVSAVSQRFQMKAELSSIYGTNSGLTLDSATWVAKSGLLNTENEYTFTYQNRLWSVYDFDSGKIKVFTPANLKNLCGITYRSTYNGAQFKVVVNMSPLAVEYGGTGAEDAATACANLHTFQTLLVSEKEFNTLESSKQLKTATVYYIYTDQTQGSNS